MFDPRGNPVSTGSAEALAAAEQALWRMMSFYGTPIDDLAAAQVADPQWLLPPLMKAGFLLSLTEPALVPEARALVDAAEAQSALPARSNPRERAHLLALQTLLAGDWPGACREWESLLLRHPCDALALQWAHLFDFYRGDSANLRQRVARVLPEWSATDPLHPYVLGQYAFGLEENHLYAQAEECGRQALGGSAKVPWAIHAVAHVMEMQGRYPEGVEWMAQWEPDWAEGNGFGGHLGWHAALFALEALDAAAALRHFDTHLAADPAQITLQRIDAAALLWRMHLLGMDTGTRWRELVDGWDVSDAAAGRYPFNDLHALLALIGCGDLARAQVWVKQVATQAERGTGSNRRVALDVGAPLMRGMLAFGLGRFDDAIDALYPARARIIRFGGSHAQRDLIDQTLIAAATRATDKSVGQALLNERRLSRPSTPLMQHWESRSGRSR